MFAEITPPEKSREDGIRRGECFGWACSPNAVGMSACGECLRAPRDLPSSFHAGSDASGGLVRRRGLRCSPQV